MTPLHRPPDCVHATRANCGPLLEAKGRRASPPWVPQREAISTSPTTWWFRHGRPQGELGEPKHVTPWARGTRCGNSNIQRLLGATSAIWEA